MSSQPANNNPPPKIGANVNAASAWGVLRMDPWHLAGVFDSQVEADNFRAQFGAAYQVAHGVFREPDDFVYTMTDDLLGASSHLQNTFFFPPTIPPEDLNEKHVYLTYSHGKTTVEGPFKIRAWRHPALPELMAMTAQGSGFDGVNMKVYNLKFDEARAKRVKRVEGEEHWQFRADLGVLQTPTQVPAAWEAVKKHYEQSVRERLKD